jgi:ribonuclease R
MCGPAPRSTARRYLRGNSVYFPDRVVPMLPERISNDLCSLKEGENRPALAVRMVIDADGKKRSHSFHRVMMRSAAKLSYQQAQAAIDGEAGRRDRAAARAGAEARSGRLRGAGARADSAGPLELDLPERKILLDATAWSPTSRARAARRAPADRGVHDPANVAAAETLEKQKRSPLIYRVHDTPSPGKAGGAAGVPASLGAAVQQGRAPFGRPTSTASSRRRAGGKIDQVSEMVLRSQAQAEYSAENYRPFRPQPRPLRPLHLADPPLCRPHRPPRADPALGSARTASPTARWPGCPPSPSTSRRPSAAPWRPSARRWTGCWRSSSPSRIGASSRGGSRA